MHYNQSIDKTSKHSAIILLRCITITCIYFSILALNLKCNLHQKAASVYCVLCQCLSMHGGVFTQQLPGLPSSMSGPLGQHQKDFHDIDHDPCDFGWLPTSGRRWGDVPY